jgi:hypothetical protein
MPEVPVQNPAPALSYGEKQAVLDFARRWPLLGKARAGEIAMDYAACLKAGEASQGEGISPRGAFDGAEYLLGIARGLSGEALFSAGERP